MELLTNLLQKAKPSYHYDLLSINFDRNLCIQNSSVDFILHLLTHQLSMLNLEIFKAIE